MKKLDVHKKSFIVALIICYVCSIFSFTCAAQSPGTGLQDIIAELQLRNESSDLTPKINKSERSGLVTRLLYTTAEIICTQQSDDGDQQQSLIVHFDYSHILPVENKVFTPVSYVRPIGTGNESSLKWSLLPEKPPPEAVV